MNQRNGLNIATTTSAGDQPGSRAVPGRNLRLDRGLKVNQGHRGVSRQFNALDSGGRAGSPREASTVSERNAAGGPMDPPESPKRAREDDHPGCPGARKTVKKE